MGPVREYAVEVALQVTNTFWCLLQPDGLERAQAAAAGHGARFNVYALLERPRIVVRPDTLSLQSNQVSGQFEVQGPEPAVYGFRLPTAFDSSGCQIECTHPYTTIRIVRDAAVVSEAKVPLLAPWMTTDYTHLADYRVSYVGQAQGDGRDAFDRLVRHETLQQVQSDIILERPETDLWILLMDFEPSTMWQMSGSSLTAKVPVDKSLDHVEQLERAVFYDRPLLINLAEAALIRHFQPLYNERFKTTFPTPHHTSYTAVYEHDLNALVFLLATQFPQRIRTYSHAVEPNDVHTMSYPLHDRTLREYIFDLFGPAA